MCGLYIYIHHDKLLRCIICKEILINYEIYHLLEYSPHLVFSISLPRVVAAGEIVLVVVFAAAVDFAFVPYAALVVQVVAGLVFEAVDVAVLVVAFLVLIVPVPFLHSVAAALAVVLVAVQVVMFVAGAAGVLHYIVAGLFHDFLQLNVKCSTCNK